MPVSHEKTIRHFIEMSLLNFACGDDHKYTSVDDFVNQKTKIVIEDLKNNKELLDEISDLESKENIDDLESKEKWNKIDKISDLSKNIFKILDDPGACSFKVNKYNYYIHLETLNNTKIEITKPKEIKTKKKKKVTNYDTISISI